MALGFLSFNGQRAEVVDYAYPASIGYAFIIGGRGRPEVDPWSFLLPFAPLVWLGVMAALVGVLGVTLLTSCFSYRTQSRTSKSLTNKLNSLRVLLQQDISTDADWLWWERVVLGVWMLTTVVLTRGYSGILISLLAVRHIPMPIQSLQDIIDNPVTLIVQKDTNEVREFKEAEGGILREVGNLEDVGRFKRVPGEDIMAAFNTLVRRGDHVYIFRNIVIRMMALDFSNTGRCDFYLAREVFMPKMISMVGPKDSPLVPSLSHRILLATEAGLYDFWYKTYTPNMTSCLRPQTKVAIKSALGITNIWGMLVVVAGGAVTSLLVFCLELLCFRLHHQQES